MDRRQFIEGAACVSALSATPFAAFARSASPAGAGNPDFEVRALEIDGDRIWQWRSVAGAFAFMEKLNLNTLVFNQNDLTETVIWPHKYYPLKLRRSRWPTRMSRVENAREYLINVTSEAKKRGIKFFFEVKEISFPDGIVELHPEVLSPNGAVCANHPFWWEFLETKYTELFNVIPDLGGIIVSPGSRESQLSFVANNCSCKTCAGYTATEWYTKLISAMYAPIKSHGKILAVRDFGSNRALMDQVIDAASNMSNDIVLMLKAMAQDFYPPQPNNPRIGHVNNHPQWIEYDCWGQFFGQGLFPCGVVEDMQRRLVYCKANGAVGIQLRTNIEWETECSVFNSFNLLNFVAGGLLCQSTTLDLDEAYKSWMQFGLYDALISESMQPDPVPIPPEYLPRLKNFMKACWGVMEKTVYVRGFLFCSGSGMFPQTVAEGYNHMKGQARLAEENGGGDSRWKDASKRVDPTEENIAIVFAEKDKALAEVQELSGILQPDSLPVSPEFKEHIKTLLRMYHIYVKGVRLCAIGCFRAKQADETKNAEVARQALRAVEDLQQYRTEVVQLLAERYYPHYVLRMFAVDYLDDFIRDVHNICSPLAKK
jgi:hypothetical protein